MKTKILLDARKLGDGGIGVYLENLIDGLLEIEKEHSILELSLLVSPSNVIESKSPTQQINLKLREWSKSLRIIEEPAGKYSFAEYFSLGFRNRNLISEHDIFHSPHYTLPYFLGIASVVTIHDLIHITHPDTLLHKPIAKFLIASALRRSKRALTVSEASRARIKDTFGPLIEKVEVIHNCLRTGLKRIEGSASEAFLTANNLESGYLLFIASERPHKRLDVLIEALLDAPDSLRLVVVGPGFSTRVKDKVFNLGLSQRVRFFEEADVERLNNFYSAAAAVILPSLEEGFGLVALEAMAFDCNLISTPLPSVREICGDYAFYTDGFKREDIANMLCSFVQLSKDDLSQKRSIVGERLQLFARDEFARKTFNAYQEVLGRKALSPINKDDSLDQKAENF